MGGQHFATLLGTIQHQNTMLSKAITYQPNHSKIGIEILKTQCQLIVPDYIVIQPFECCMDFVVDNSKQNDTDICC